MSHPRNSAIAQYGQLVIEPLSQVEAASAIVRSVKSASQRVAVYHWKPIDKICQDIPNDFEFKMLCSTHSNGVRRFYPMGGYLQLRQVASVGGLAILSHFMSMSAEQRRSYRTMFLLYQKALGFREHYGRNFRGLKDLTLKRSARDSLPFRDVLPMDLGLDSHGQGRRWGIDRLKTEGRAIANGLGNDRPSEQDQIEFGLFAAAKRNPLTLSSAKDVEGLVRMSLYDYVLADSKCDDKDKNTIIKIETWIEEQILQAIDAHLEDSSDKFDDWFRGPKNSFLKQISRKKCPHGTVTNNMVRMVLLRLGWESYCYLAGCIHAQMRSFQNALPERLSDAEKMLYEMAYLPQNAFADLPLVLLRERISFLRAPILHLWAASDEFDFVGTVHRLLSYYAEMVLSRRQGDRNARNYSVASKDIGRNLRTFQYDEERPVEDNGNRWVNRPRRDDDEDSGWED